LQGGEKISDDGIESLFNELDTMKLGYLNYEDFVYLLLPK
jgi:Ca2+-binding EF-hand superfamily protein